MKNKRDQEPRVVLACEGIEKRFGDDLILHGVDLTLRQGELVSVLGQSGNGKTTLFNILAGLDEPGKGRVLRSSDAGYMLQKDMLLPWKRLIDNVALPLILAGETREEARAKAAVYFETFGLEGLEYRYPSQLSGGQRRRAAFLRTYLYSNDLMLLDEPFTGLDAITRSQIHEWLLAHKEALGLSILLITHDIEEALTLSDRIYVLSQGPPSSLWPSLDVSQLERLNEGPSLDGHYRWMGKMREEIRRRIFTAL